MTTEYEFVMNLRRMICDMHVESMDRMDDSKMTMLLLLAEEIADRIRGYQYREAVAAGHGFGLGPK